MVMTIPLFLIPLIAGLVAQALKPLFARDRRNEQAATLDTRPRYGGMPSAHVAFATSLMTATGIAEGPASALFAVAVAMLIFVLDDALRLRIFLGRYGVALRRLLERSPRAVRKDLPPIEWQMGHTVPEVFGGITVGLLVTLAIFLLESGRWSLNASP